MSDFNLLIVIVCYRAADLTIACLRSLAPQINDVPGTRVAICENGTGEESVTLLSDAIAQNGWNEWVTLTAISPNRGFTGGNNAILVPAMKAEQVPKYFMLLNADTIVRPGALKSLFEAAEVNPSWGILGPTLVDENGSQQSSCFRYPTIVSEFLRVANIGFLNQLFGRGPFCLAPKSQLKEFDWTSFACAIIRSEVIRDIGPLDEGYFLYFDDVDYCRMANNAGWKIGHCQTAIVEHLEGKSTKLAETRKSGKRLPSYFYESRKYYYKKYTGNLGYFFANIAWYSGRLFSKSKEAFFSRSSITCDQEWKDIWAS